jgi:uncharacterized membrane protein YphA (DoxX/SURF4 family)
MEQGLTVIEVLFRIVLGLRFLSSGLSNVRRWPNPVKNARLVFSFGQKFFGAAAVALMVAGGAGLALGLFTRIAAWMIVVFLIPTFKIQWHWLQVFPETVRRVGSAVVDASARDDFQVLSKHAIHAHEVGLQDNLVLLVAALFFALRGSVAFAIDNLLR